MTERRKFTRRGVLAGGAGLASLLAMPHIARAQSKTYKIALSNSFIGNQWRVQMVNLTQALARKYFDGKVELNVVSSGPEVQRQIQTINEMTASGVDAILVNPASDAALNPAIEEAISRGVTVVVFDQPVSSDAPYFVGIDLVDLGRKQAQWMADTLNGKGRILYNRGVAGFAGDKLEVQGVSEVLSKYPDIKIVAEVYGNWDQSVSQAEIAKVLPAHPDLDGVINQAGEYGAVLAFQNAGREMVPMAGEASNGFRKFMLSQREAGFKGFSIGDPPSVGPFALKTVVDILDGKGPSEKKITMPAPSTDSDGLKPGVNVFPDLPDTIYPDIQIPVPGFELTIDDALKA
jgi:ribose transport system substrate-binding protein